MWTRRKTQPIGLDIGRRAVKVAQVERTEDGARLVDHASRPLPAAAHDDAEAREQAAIEILRDVLQQGRFRGRQAVISLDTADLFVQNVRVPKIDEQELDNVVRWEAEERVPHAGGAAPEVRYLVAGDVRQGDEVRHEVILFATRPECVQRQIRLLEAVKLQPAAIDVHPCAVFRWFQNQLRRKSDAASVNLYVDLGACSTKVIVGRGDQIVFVKDIEIGGRHFDEAVAAKLDMDLADAGACRTRLSDPNVRPGGRADDPAVTRAVFDAVRPVVENLGREVSLCVRYCTVTFRGPKVDTAYVFGGEATPPIVEMLAERLEMPVKLADPRPALQSAATGGEDAGPGADSLVALGLSLR